MDEVDGLGSGREVGRLEFPKTFGFKDCGKKEKNKNEAWEKNSEREENKNHEKKKF